MTKCIISLLASGAMACNQPGPVTLVNKMEPVAVKKDTPGAVLIRLNFAGKKDPVCGMPLSAGVSDTAHYKGKIYGFCAAGCKAEFIKNPEIFVTAK